MLGAPIDPHDQVISGIDWSARSNKIVTASHDRNSYVWNLEGSDPKENKFAVGSGAKTVCICYYEQENNWWVSKLIRKRHDSSVTSVSWHPDNILLATTSTDGKCRVFSTFIKGVDAKNDNMKDSKKSTSSDMKFVDSYVGHNSMIYFVDDVGPSPLAQNAVFRDLPLRDVGIICF
ncbi:Actin-related protein 2/3 complex subunit 1A [Trifolium repens]|nr:Actin-related protein 2/3 complex subunit 1A [Trifolium repens]